MAVYFTLNIFTYLQEGLFLIMWISAAADKLIQPRKSVLFSSAYSIMYYFIVGILLFSGAGKIIDQVPTIETLKAAFKLHDEINLIVATISPVIDVALAFIILSKYKLKIILASVITASKKRIQLLNRESKRKKCTQFRVMSNSKIDINNQLLNLNNRRVFE